MVSQWSEHIPRCIRRTSNLVHEEHHSSPSSTASHILPFTHSLKSTSTPLLSIHFISSPGSTPPTSKHALHHPPRSLHLRPGPGITSSHELEQGTAIPIHDSRCTRKLSPPSAQSKSSPTAPPFPSRPPLQQHHNRATPSTTSVRLPFFSLTHLTQSSPTFSQTQTNTPQEAKPTQSAPSLTS